MQSLYNYNFSIADVVISLQTMQPITVTSPFLPFCTEKKADYNTIFREVPFLPEISGKEVGREISYSVCQDDNGGYYRLFRDAAHEKTTPYALSRAHWERKQVLIDYLSEGRPFVNETNNCFFHTGWETILLHEKRIILHGACVETARGGIVFFGRSGIGKSTQAELWCRYQSARQINGDRPILYKTNHIWYAYGSPYAGSSKCHVNARCPITAIVVLQKAEKCSIRRLGVAEAFKKLFTGLTVSIWDAAGLMTAGDLTAELATDVPVYELRCTPDKAAVDLLRNELSRSENG